MVEIKYTETTQGREINFIPEIDEESWREPLNKFFDEVIKRAHYLYEDPRDIKNIVIDSQKLGVSSDKLRKLFYYYVGEKTRKTNYLARTARLNIAIIMTYLGLGTLRIEALQDPIFDYFIAAFIPLSLAISGVADYLHRRKARKVMDIEKRIYIK